MRLFQKFKNAVFYGEVSTLPGCAGVAVSHSLFREGSSGFGVQANRLRLSQIKGLGYSCVICTVDECNDKQRAILTKTGWKNLKSFRNKATGHWVEIWFHDLSGLELKDLL